jgi:hypothetical protein
VVAGGWWAAELPLLCFWFAAGNDRFGDPAIWDQPTIWFVLYFISILELKKTNSYVKGDIG